ncbi:MAG TPA: hypothetical protein VF278_06405 [Pirellulales bacterium]
MNWNQSTLIVTVFLAAAVVLTAIDHCSHADDRDPIEALASATQAVAETEALRRKEAAEELEQLRERISTQEARVKYMRRWTQITFQLEERNLISRPRTVSRYLQRLENQRETTKHVLLQFGEQSRGGIVRGTALNFFVDQCGPAAFELSYRRLLGPKAAPDGGDEIERELLNGLSKNYTIDESMLRHLRYRQGSIGAKLTGRINRVPLDLDELPLVLRQSEYTAQIDLVRSFRDHAIKELTEGKPISEQTTRHLIGALDDLNIAVQTETNKRAKQGSAAYLPYSDAVRHLKMLATGAKRLVEAQRREDVILDEFNGGNIEDLLAFMYRNNLHFHESDKNGEPTYRFVFELLAKYYTDLCAMQQAAADAASELGALRAQEQKLEDIKLGVALSNLQKADLLGKGADAVAAAFGAYAKQQEAKRAEAENR